MATLPPVEPQLPPAPDPAHAPFEAADQLAPETLFDSPEAQQQSVQEDIMGGVEQPSGPGDSLATPMDGGMPVTPAAPPAPSSDLFAPDDPSAPQNPEEELLQRQAAMKALYGDQFPLAQEKPPESGDWAKWAMSLWDRHQPGKRKRLHLVERNRLFRKDLQWISSDRTLGPWREPMKPKDAVRAVYNMIAPALDQRVQIIAEQRPGFQTRPLTHDPDDLKRAEAQQVALEYQFDQQTMADVIRETCYWTGTDGVAFWCVYWDADAGPWHEEGADATPQGGPQTGQPMMDAQAPPNDPMSVMSAGGVGAPPMPGPRYQLGDPRTRVYRIEQVCVSANATATQKPTYWVVKETIPVAEAIAFHGQTAVESASSTGTRSSADAYGFRMGMEVASDMDPFEDQDTVDRYTVFCAKSEYLPEGCTVVALGEKDVYVSGLVCGVVPMVRVTDGSTDPAFFPRPIMDTWIDHQVRVNAVLSKWIESVRLNSGGRFLAKPKVIAGETMVGGLHSTIEVRTPGPIGDAVVPVNGFSVGNDAKELLSLEKKGFEEVSGWSDASRGSFSSDASGRAIMATREALERIFSEPVNATARAASDWGRINLHWMKWGYDIPRAIAVTGKSRPDLGRAISADDFDGVADVTVDPETMMPMPRALRLFLIDQMFEKGVMTPQEYRQRIPFASVRNMGTPDEDQLARAMRICEAIRNMQPPPEMRWTDNEAIFQDTLEREILLRDDLDPQIIQFATQTWIGYANQSMMKQGGMPLGGAPAPTGGPPHVKPGTPPGGQPMLANNPSIAAAPVAQMLGGNGNPRQMGQHFDNTRQG